MRTKCYPILNTRYGSIFVRKILESDLEQHCYNSPANEISLILSGGYFEETPSGTFKLFRSWTLNLKKASDAHRITLVKKPTWTLVFTGKRYHTWGYIVDGEFIESTVYRQMKNKGEL